MLLDAPSKRPNRRVLELILVLVRGLALACRGHHELVLENLALRQQLNALRRTGTRPQLRRPSTDTAIRTLVKQVAGANPLRGAVVRQNQIAGPG